MKMLHFTFIFLFLTVTFLSTAQNVGVGTDSPSQQLTVDGKIKIGDDNSPPSIGTIRYDSLKQDFEGWTGSEWKSFTFNTSDISTEITHPSALSNGNDVDMNSVWAISGANGSNSALVFKHTFDWGLQYFIHNNEIPSNDTSDRFGWNVELLGASSSSGALVSAPFNDHNGKESGIVSVYSLTNSNATFEYVIAPSDVAAFDYFGYSVSTYVNAIAISSPSDDDGQSGAGSVYLYTNTGSSATFNQKVTSPLPQESGRFGHNIKLHAQHLFVQAYGEDVNGFSNPGRVYDFVKNSTGLFVLNQIIDNPDPMSNVDFGRTIEVFGNNVVIGSLNTSGGTVGAVFYYALDNSTNVLTYKQKITVPFNSINDNFGTGIALGKNKMVISAPGYDAKGRDSGVLFLYEKNGATWSLSKSIPVSSAAFGTKIGASLSTYSSFDNDEFMMGSPQFPGGGAVHFLKIY